MKSLTLLLIKAVWDTFWILGQRGHQEQFKLVLVQLWNIYRVLKANDRLAHQAPRNISISRSCLVHIKRTTVTLLLKDAWLINLIKIIGPRLQVIQWTSLMRIVCTRRWKTKSLSPIALYQQCCLILLELEIKFLGCPLARQHIGNQ